MLSHPRNACSQIICIPGARYGWLFVGLFEVIRFKVDQAIAVVDGHPGLDQGPYHVSLLRGSTLGYRSPTLTASLALASVWANFWSRLRRLVYGQPWRGWKTETMVDVASYVSTFTFCFRA